MRVDRKYFEQRYAEELEAAANAACEASRSAHEQLARAYDEAAGRIGKPVAVVTVQSNRPGPTGDRPLERRTG